MKKQQMNTETLGNPLPHRDIIFTQKVITVCK